jgi:hypothetical protein
MAIVKPFAEFMVEFATSGVTRPISKGRLDKYHIYASAADLSNYILIHNVSTTGR